MEQDKYIQEIVKLTKPSFFDCMIGLGTNTLDSNAHFAHSVTPINNRRRFASKIEKAVQNLKPNFNIISSSSSSSHSSAQSTAINNNNSQAANAIINYAANTKAAKCKFKFAESRHQ